MDRRKAIELCDHFTNTLLVSSVLAVSLDNDIILPVSTGDYYIIKCFSTLKLFKMSQMLIITQKIETVLLYLSVVQRRHIKFKRTLSRPQNKNYSINLARFKKKKKNKKNKKTTVEREYHLFFEDFAMLEVLFSFVTHEREHSEHCYSCA